MSERKDLKLKCQGSKTILRSHGGDINEQMYHMNANGSMVCFNGKGLWVGNLFACGKGTYRRHPHTTGVLSPNYRELYAVATDDAEAIRAHVFEAGD